MNKFNYPVYDNDAKLKCLQDGFDKEFDWYSKLDIIAERKNKDSGIIGTNLYLNQLLDVYSNDEILEWIKCDLNWRKKQINLLSVRLRNEKIKLILKNNWKYFILIFIIILSLKVLI